MMSSVIGGAMLPHAPQFFTMPETEDRDTVARVKRAAAEIGTRLRALRPDLWIIFANDHVEQFFHTAAPPFTIHVGDEAKGEFAGRKFHWRGVWKRSYGRPTKAPPDERGGNRHGRPNTTAPHPDSTRLGPSSALRCKQPGRLCQRGEPGSGGRGLHRRTGLEFRRLQDRQIGRMLIQHSWNEDTPLMRGSSPPLATGHDANMTASRRSDARSS